MSRPVKFNRPNVIEKSMRLFWENGYKNTSIKQLSQHMDMRPGSLYAAFKSKRQLFLQALELYFEQSSRQLTERLKLGDTPLTSIRAYFSKLIDDLMNKQSIKGCLMINTATELAEHDEEIKNRLDEMFSSHELQFYQLLQQAQSTGELASGKDAESLARFLLMGIRGIKVYSQTGTSRKHLEGLVDNLLIVLSQKV